MSADITRAPEQCYNIHITLNLPAAGLELQYIRINYCMWDNIHLNAASFKYFSNVQVMLM